ncbi:hypothetical protein L484_002880 [Morus notabilis]|uniref:Uncharacterized protein n=1 Tax=Morus notabilis TaxID=981085 RepID=W9S9H4_9ROSA|nr:hypothetical protein L484_002880 [Morus notabilis]
MGGSGVNGVEIEAFANDNPIIHAIVVLKSEVNRLVTLCSSFQGPLLHLTFLNFRQQRPEFQTFTKTMIHGRAQV